MKRVIALGSGFMMMVMRGWRSHLLNLLLAEKICCCKQKPNGHLSVRGSWSDKCPRLGQAAPRQGRGQRKVNYHRSQSILSLITLDGTGKANGQAGWRHRFITGSWSSHIQGRPRGGGRVGPQISRLPSNRPLPPLIRRWLRLNSVHQTVLRCPKLSSRPPLVAAPGQNLVSAIRAAAVKQMQIVHFFCKFEVFPVF